MKRSVLCIFLAVSVLLLSAYAATSAPLMQESSESSEGTDIIHAVSVFSQIFSAGMEAAASQLAGGEMYGTDAVTDEPAPEPAGIPTAIPTEIPIAVPAEEAAPLPPFSPEPAGAETAVTEPEPVYEPEAQVFTPPSDPEPYAVSFGIPVDDFYGSFKNLVKSYGRHSVSFEEKGRKNASRVTVDDDINIYLYYNKEGRENLISRINYETVLSDEKQQKNAEVVFSVLAETLCSYFDIAYDELTGSDLFALARVNGSAYLGDLMVYGSTAPKGGGTELIVKVYYSGSTYVKDNMSGYSQSAESEFRDMVADLKQSGIIPESSGEFRYHGDYENEWAYLRWYQWESFDKADNFVISADLEWHSASNTPNFADAGCGFVFRAEDTNNNLYAALNMDGKVHIGGIKDGSWLGSKEYSYGTHSVKGNGQLLIAVNGDTITAYVDGIQVGQQKNLPFTGSGNLAFSVWSGTNKDYGTRCNFSNVYYYVW